MVETFEQYRDAQPVGVTSRSASRALHLVVGSRITGPRSLCYGTEAYTTLILHEARLPLCLRCTDIARKEWMAAQREAKTRG